MLHNALNVVTTHHHFVQNGTETRVATLLSQHKGVGKININWVLLDSQLTVDIFCSPKLLKDIRRVGKSIEIHCNAGFTTTHLVGHFEGYGTVRYDPEGMANILSLHRVVENYHVQYGSRTSNRFIV